MVLPLIQGAALLLALCFLHSINARLWRQRPRWGQVMAGLLFGAICMVGMLKPLELLPGIFFDARTAVLSMAALFGGPLTGAIATLLALATRLALDGHGTVVGVLVILAAFGLGLAYRRLGWPRHPWALLLFGLVLHLVALALFQALPAATVLRINSQLAWPYVLILAPATALLGWLLADIARREDTERALTENAARLHAIANALPDLVLLLSEEGRYLEVLSGNESLQIAPTTTLLGQCLEDVLPAQQAAELRTYLRRSLDTGTTQTVQYTLETPVGLRHFEGRCQPLRTPIQGRAAVVFIARDRTAQVQAEAALRESEMRFRTLLSNLPAISVQGYRADGTTIFWNQAAEQLYGYRSEEALGKSLYELIIPPEARSTVRAEVAQMFATTVPIAAAELTLMHKSGQPVEVFSSHAYVHVPGQEPEMFCIDIDISLRKAAEEQARYLAYYDALTGLPNRRLLTDRLQQVLAGSVRHSDYAAVLFLDLDHFKTLNDSLGHEAGDQVLVQAARRLQACVRSQDTVARLGGDEFVLLLHHLGAHAESAAAHVRSLGDKLLEQLRQPYVIEDGTHHLSASIGATLIGPQPTALEDVLKQADLAMYRAKEEGRDTLRFFDPLMQARVNQRAQLQTELHQALREEEFVLFLQPQVDARQRILGAEALIRWQHPEKGLITPGTFIPLAEETGHILALGDWVLTQALRLQARWLRDPALAALQLSINVSARQFRQEDFVARVREQLLASGAQPQYITLELTESMMLQDTDSVLQTMEQLRALDIRLSLDDFGTGYSSLAYLKRLPLHQLKLDQNFVRNVLHDAKDAAIAHSIIGLAHSMGLDVVAEGVETAAQYDFLRTHGCHRFQGYWFAKPMPIADFEQRLHARPRQ